MDADPCKTQHDRTCRSSYVSERISPQKCLAPLHDNNLSQLPNKVRKNFPLQITQIHISAVHTEQSSGGLRCLLSVTLLVTIRALRCEKIPSMKVSLDIKRATNIGKNKNCVRVHSWQLATPFAISFKQCRWFVYSGIEQWIDRWLRN